MAQTEDLSSAQRITIFLCTGNDCTERLKADNTVKTKNCTFFLTDCVSHRSFRPTAWLIDDSLLCATMSVTATPEAVASPFRRSVFFGWRMMCDIHAQEPEKNTDICVWNDIVAVVTIFPVLHHMWIKWSLILHKGFWEKFPLLLVKSPSYDQLCHHLLKQTVRCSFQAGLQPWSQSQATHLVINPAFGRSGDWKPNKLGVSSM